MIKVEVRYVYIFYVYESGLLIGISACFDNECSARELANKLKKSEQDTILVVKRALLN